MMACGLRLLDTTHDTDCRKFKKDYGDSVKNQRDWHDCLYQNIIRKKYLYNYYAVQVRT